ncbi:MAG: hypothetical protein ACOC3Z_00230 [Nanoarchaeota archaeon]
MKQEIYEKITKKKEFSQLPKKDVELAWKKFEKRQTSENEKIKLTRDLLRKVFSVFTSKKLLNIKDKDLEWVLKKHLSTKERFDYYNELYLKLFRDFNKEIVVFDLGAGVNGFSIDYLIKLKNKIKYIGVESVGQLVSLMNYYFEKNNYNAFAIHESLYNIDNIKSVLKNEKKNKIVFLFKVIDSLEMIKRDYSKEFLNEISPLCNRIVVSFATRSLVSKKRFNVKRNWIIDFIKDNFNIINDFELGNERYIIFENKK